jgi:hypothetical protein
VRRWLSHAAGAARLVGERPELWLAGALASVVYLGWAPLIIAVTPAPNAGDLTYLAVQLLSSAIFPWNLVAIGFLAAMLVLLAAGLAAFAELVLISAVRGPAPPGLGGRIGGSVAIILVGALPAVGVAIVVALNVVALAPDRFFSTVGLGEIVAGLARDLWPLLALGLAALCAGQAIGAIGIRALRRGGPRAVAGALGAAGRELVRHPLPVIGNAVIGLAVDLAVVLVTVAVLRALWAPIALDLDAGRFSSPSTLLLLLGFVAIWLALLLAAGAARAWLSAWWSLEVSPEA